MALASVAAEDLGRLDDERLVAAVAAGCDQALAEIYRRHAPFVRAVARRPLQSGDLAEEAVQDVFLQLWSTPGRFDPARGSLRAYLQVQGYRRAVDLHRSESARRRREERDDRGPSSPSEVIDLTAALEIRGAIAGLAPHEREAIELAFFGGHSYREVALMLGQPEGTVKNRIRAGLRRLRGRLSQLSSTPPVELASI